MKSPLHLNLSVIPLADDWLEAEGRLKELVLTEGRILPDIGSLLLEQENLPEEWRQMCFLFPSDGGLGNAHGRLLYCGHGRYPEARHTALDCVLVPAPPRTDSWEVVPSTWVGFSDFKALVFTDR